MEYLAPIHHSLTEPQPAMLASLAILVLFAAHGDAVRTVTAYDGNCYEFGKDLLAWQDARDRAKTMFACSVQGHLLTVSSSAGVASSYVVLAHQSFRERRDDHAHWGEEHVDGCQPNQQRLALCRGPRGWHGTHILQLGRHIPSGHINVDRSELLAFCRGQVDQLPAELAVLLRGGVRVSPGVSALVVRRCWSVLPCSVHVRVSHALQ